MSLRSVGTCLFKHGTNLFRNICRREINSNKIIETINAITPSNAPEQVVRPKNFAIRNIGVQLGIQARKILIDNVLNRVTNSLAADLRKKAARRILYGDSRPFFALVGVSLASGTGLLTKQEELEGVCWEIREAVAKIKWNPFDVNIDQEINNLDNLELGKPIAKGTNGVVYSAKVKSDNQENNENLIEKYPFALKMMFNYDIQSNSTAILKAMYRETVPARFYYSNCNDAIEWESEFIMKKSNLPPHPNIVSIFSVFTDFIRNFDDSETLYPAALPRRLHPDGEGRNMSLFLLMKRYNMNLQQFMDNLLTPLPIRTSIFLFVQLLEGVTHLIAHSIAHRDLKSDNLLLDTTEISSPLLVISDFGCCLADKINGLSIPYTSYEIDKGGNATLMAPEIINQRPGTFSVLNYSKSDLWAVGTIAYEIFGCLNPFYGKNNNGILLKNSNYKEDELPKLPNDVPIIFKELIKNLLKRSPYKRLDPEIAANIGQLYLWAPKVWLNPDNKLPTNAEILQWLLSLTTKVLYEGHFNYETFGNGRKTYPEYLLISCFLCRVKLSKIRAALTWIQNNNSIE